MLQWGQSVCTSKRSGSRVHVRQNEAEAECVYSGAKRIQGNAGGTVQEDGDGERRDSGGG